MDKIIQRSKVYQEILDDKTSDKSWNNFKWDNKMAISKS